MNRTIAIICSAIFFPVSLLAALLTSAYLKSVNPDNVDVSQGLAYLAHIIIAAAVVMAALLVIGLVFTILTYSQDGFKSAKLPLALLVVNVVLVVLIALTNAYINRVQDRYLIDHGRPTLQQYFAR